MRRLIASTVVAVALVAGPAGAHIGQNELFTSERLAPGASMERVDSSGGPSRSTRAAEPPLVPVPRAVCGPGARKETGIQGRVSRADHRSGLAAKGLRCNTELVGQHTQEKVEGQVGTVGTVGGYKVVRYVDRYRNECAFYDTSLLPPSGAADANVGVRVLDMRDPMKPALSNILATTAMSFPHESLILSENRGLLIAVAGNLGQSLIPGQIDIYDLNAAPDLGCRAPVLISSTPLGIFGHESGIAPDGNTFYSSSLSNETVTAVDISNPALPRLIVQQQDVAAHGLSLSPDGKTAYVARGQNSNGFEIYDVSSIQNREANPRMERLSKLTWKHMSVPQSTIPISIKGKPFVIESDEFLRNGADRTGASRIIDVSDPKNPFIISNLRLEVHQEENRIGGKLQDDPGTSANGTNPFSFAQDYTGHFCNVPTRVDPTIVACGMSISGLRVFNIEDPYNPREVAYFTAPVQPRPGVPEGSNWAYSQPTFAPERKEVWYSEAYTGFYAVRLTNGAWPDPAGAGAGCRDTTPPRSRIVRASRRRITGTASDRGCPKRKGRVAKVTVAVGRAVGRDCRFLRADGRFGPTRSCLRTSYLPARGTTSWSLRLRGRLPRGSYKLFSRGVDVTGNVERKDRKRNFRALRVR